MKGEGESSGESVVFDRSLPWIGLIANVQDHPYLYLSMNGSRYSSSKLYLLAIL